MFYMCTHMCLYIYVQTHKLHVWFMLVCTYSYLCTYVCTSSLSTPKQIHTRCADSEGSKKIIIEKEMKQGFEDTGHTTRYTDFGGQILCCAYVYLFWVKRDTGQHNNCFKILGGNYLWKKRFNSFIWFQRLEMRPA